MLRVAIELNDRNIKGVDLGHPEHGNPGIGGSEFLFVLLAHCLYKNYDDVKVTIYHYNMIVLPQGINEVIVDSEDDFFCKLDENEDILIHQVSKSKMWYQRINRISIKGIAWAHVYPEIEEIQYITDCKNIRRVVFVGKEEYDAYIDDDVIEKSTYIYNMLDTSRSIERDKKFGHEVTYVGSLVPAKGFHLLAQIWPDIIRKIPDAELNVIGNGRVYDRGAKLGKYNIAQDNYEKLFMKYLTDKNGNILPSVHFLGLQDVAGKNTIFKRTAVGVVNPSGVSETFCMSAVEMQLSGIPVVTIRKYGLLDTVKHNITGLLFNTTIGFENNIVILLKNRELNQKLSSNGIKYVKNEFDCNNIIEKWYKLLKEVENNATVCYYKPFGAYFNNCKLFRCAIRLIRFRFGIKGFPSYIRMKYLLKNIMHR